MLRIRRDRAWELSHLDALLAAAADLGAFADLDAAALPAALAPRLGLLRRALLASPYHREALAARGLAPDDLQQLTDLAAFPLLDRATLAGRWRDLPVDGADDDWFVAASSGSTGAPARVVRRTGEPLHMWAVLRFFLARLRLELPRRPRVVLLDTLPAGLEYSARLPLLHDGALHRISTHRPRAAERLARVAPAVIFTDPEGLAWLLDRPIAPGPRLLLSSASHLAPELRRRAEAVAPVVDYYSTTESGPIAWACPAGSERFHLLVPDVWVESVDGELVVTRLRPGALPLLRYRTGDRGTVATATPCACGHRGPSIVGLRGRSACDFITPAGVTVDAWRLAPALRDLPLRAFRVTQLAPDRFQLELADDGHRDAAAAAAALTHALLRLGFGAPAVSVTAGADLADPAKAEPFRCLVATSTAAANR